MLTQEILDIYKLIDRPGKVATKVAELFTAEGLEPEITPVTSEFGSTEFIKIRVPGLKDAGKNALGLIGRLGGIGARPERLGLVSDADGALVALAVALKLGRMRSVGDILAEDVIISTHLCTDAPTKPHDPVPFMSSPVDMQMRNKIEIDPKMGAIISIDTSRGNRIVNHNGFAITPTVKEGWILRVAEDLLDIMQNVSGSVPAVVPITMQDITPYDNDLYHFNSIMQPAIATKAPVVGVALTSEVAVPGSATGVSNLAQLDLAGRYVLEVAKAYTAGKLSFYDPEEYEKLCELYGKMNKLIGQI